MKFAIFWIFGLNFGFAVSVSWNGNWAFACDFKGNDISNAQVLFLKSTTFNRESSEKQEYFKNSWLP
jgi:hypothetical protein